MQTGVIIAIVVCCCLLILGTVLGIYFSGVTCPDFGYECTASPGPAGSPGSPGSAATARSPGSPSYRAPGAPGLGSLGTTPDAGGAAAPITCPSGQFRTSPTTCSPCSQCPTGSPLVGACIGDSDTRCLGCQIGKHVVNNACVDCPVGYTTSGFGGECVAAAVGTYRGSCSTDSNCTDPGQICCMGTCGDASYCNSKCPSGKMFYNGNKTCITQEEYNSILAAMNPQRNYANGTACANNNDCSSGFCNVFKQPAQCHAPQVGAGESCTEWWECDQSDALDCRNGRCIRPYSD